MSDFKKYLAQQMEDPAFAAEYEAQRPEYEAIRAVIAARLACNMTQKELAEKTGIRQSNIDPSMYHCIKPQFCGLINDALHADIIKKSPLIVQRDIQKRNSSWVMPLNKVCRQDRREICLW